MPLLQSAKKALRQTERRRERNLLKKTAYKKAIKYIRKLLAVGKTDEAKKLLPIAYKALDKAAKTGVIKKGKADRLKSRLAKKFSPKSTGK